MANGNGSDHGPSEVTITRRLYRSGESEYLIDGKIARLRDIQDLFIGTGLGPESYAIIEQGRIGQILSNKSAGSPGDHRRSGRHRQIQNQEAAGGSEAGRRQTESGARVRHSGRSRPAGKFAEAAGVQGQALRRTEDRDGRATAPVADGRYRMLEREAAKTALDLNLANADFQSLSNQVAECEKEHVGLAGDVLSQRRGADRGARKQLADLQLEQERTRGQLDSQAQQIGAIEQRLTQGEAEAQELEKRQTQFQQELEAHLQSLAELEAQTESARERLAAKSAERERLQQALAGSRDERSKPAGNTCCGCWAKRRR